MKKILFFIFILLSISSFSQEVYSFKSGGRVFNSNNQKISPSEVRNLLASNQPALELYNAGRSKKTFGNVLLYGGIAAGIGSFFYQASIPAFKQAANGQLVQNDEYSNTMFYVSGAIVLLAIPIKIGFSKKIKKAVALLNDSASKPTTSFLDSTTIIANQNGIGVHYSF